MTRMNCYEREAYWRKMLENAKVTLMRFKAESEPAIAPIDVPTEEPIVHSHHIDVLPEDHPKAYESVRCERCNVMVHAFNNECMTTWIEWGTHIMCGRCFSPLLCEGSLDYGDFVNRTKNS
jgi:hypothetical protein